jgi:hypothetical protein
MVELLALYEVLKGWDYKSFRIKRGKYGTKIGKRILAGQLGQSEKLSVCNPHAKSWSS